MALKIEQFDHPELIQLAMCGAIEDISEQFAAKLDKPIRTFAKIDGEGGSTFVILIVNQFDNDECPEQKNAVPAVHFHIELARESFFFEHSPPQIEEKRLDELLCFVDEFKGTKINSIIDSRFSFDLSRLSRDSVISPILEIDAESENGIHLTMTGGRCDLGPPPPRRMNWFVRHGDPEVLIVDIEAIKDFVISDNYILEAAQCVLRPFDDIVAPIN